MSEGSRVTVWINIEMMRMQMKCLFFIHYEQYGTRQCLPPFQKNNRQSGQTNRNDRID